jgi:hypothetical protein
MKQLLLNSPSGYVVLIFILSLGLSYLLYAKQKAWSKSVNRILFVLRASLLFAILLLLLDPIVKRVSRYFEKPILVLLYDQSESVALGLDSLARNELRNRTDALEAKLSKGGYELAIQSLEGSPVNKDLFSETTTDIQRSLREISSQYEGKNVAGVVLISDGIYNQGISPLHRSFNFPIYTVGVGDTTVRQDILIKSVSYNKIAYQGNKFPIRVELHAKGMKHFNAQVRLLHKGKLIQEQHVILSDEQTTTVDFFPIAEEKGIQKFDIELIRHPNEQNVRNNTSVALIDVVEGKKKILLVASSPHPDIKAIREVVDKNENYDFKLHIPGVIVDKEPINVNEIDLVVFHQSPDLRGTTRALFQQFLSANTPMWIIVGSQTDLRQLAPLTSIFKIESFPRDYDQVVPSLNPNFSFFSLSPDVVSAVTKYPYVSVHFGKISAPDQASVLLYQQIGNVVSSKPLLYTTDQQGKRIGVMLGEGIWRWPLSEYDREEDTKAFSEFLGKLIQYLSSVEDKQRFKSYPIQQTFNESESVVFESQVYNSIFESVYGNTINIDITNGEEKKYTYQYVLSQGNTKYQIGNLPAGIYQYRASTQIDGKEVSVRGDFAIESRQLESLNVTADFNLLRKLSSQTNGTFVQANEIDTLGTILLNADKKEIIHSEENFLSAIHIKLIFWLLILIVSIEWIARKYWGSY